MWVLVFLKWIWLYGFKINVLRDELVDLVLVYNHLINVITPVMFTHRFV